MCTGDWGRGTEETVLEEILTQKRVFNFILFQMAQSSSTKSVSGAKKPGRRAQILYSKVVAPVRQLLSQHD